MHFSQAGCQRVAEIHLYLPARSWGQRQMRLCLAFMWVWGSKCSVSLLCSKYFTHGTTLLAFFYFVCLFVLFFVSFLKLIYFEAGFLLVSLAVLELAYSKARLTLNSSCMCLHYLAITSFYFKVCFLLTLLSPSFKSKRVL